ncbi:MAG: hypothetical protein ACRES9_04990 [Gammaproteobacteria bacterium]
MRKTILILAVVGAALALAACASKPKPQLTQQQVAQNQKSKQVCISRTPVGSHIAKTYCMSEATYKVFQAAEQNSIDHARSYIESHEGNKAGASSCAPGC